MHVENRSTPVPSTRKMKVSRAQVQNKGWRLKGTGRSNVKSHSKKGRELMSSSELIPALTRPPASA